MNRKLTVLMVVILFSIFAINIFEINGNYNIPITNNSGNSDLTSSSTKMAFTANGIKITNCTSNQYQPVKCCISDDGAIIAWCDYRYGNYDIFAQKILANGSLAWELSGVEICTASNTQTELVICSDGSGGTIIAWEDRRTGGDYDIYAQKVNSSGVVEWTDDGVAVCTVTNYSSNINVQMCTDGEGGAILTWEDHRLSIGDPNIFGQRINSDGSMNWTPNGILIHGETTWNWLEEDQRMCSDGAGGAYITWQDDEISAGNNRDIVIQRVNSSGDLLWGSVGVPLTSLSALGSTQQYPEICYTGSGEAIITWEDYRNGNCDIYAQKINRSGLIQWPTANGELICNELMPQEEADICSDGSGGAIIAWTDQRDSPNPDIYAQKIDSLGNVSWTLNGTAVCTASDEQTNVNICGIGSGSTLIVWDDYRNGTYYDIYGQKINSAGDIEGSTNGFVICDANHNQDSSDICCDGSGSAYIAWRDVRTGSSVIYAQKIIYEPDEDDWLYILLMAAMSSGGGFLGLSLTTWLIIGAAGAVVLIIIIVAVAKRKK